MPSWDRSFRFLAALCGVRPGRVGVSPVLSLWGSRRRRGCHFLGNKTVDPLLSFHAWEGRGPAQLGPEFQIFSGTLWWPGWCPSPLRP